LFDSIPEEVTLDDEVATVQSSHLSVEVTELDRIPSPSEVEENHLLGILTTNVDGRRKRINVGQWEPHRVFSPPFDYGTTIQ
jgi:hypothetical protein